MSTYETTRTRASVEPEPARTIRTASSGTDLDEACLHWEQTFGGRDFRAQGVGSTTAWRTSAVGDERVVLRSSSLPARLGGEVPWPERYTVGWFREGSGSVEHRRGQHRSEAAEPFSLPVELPFSLALTPHVQNLVQIAPGFFEDTASEVHGGPSQLVVLDHRAGPRAKAVDQWRRTLAAVTGPLVDVAESPLRRLDAQLLLVRAVLELFPWTVSDVPQVVRAAGAGRLRDAVDFVHEHVHEPITPSDIARAAELHPRTLQQTMSRQLGASPAAYVRQVRLERVRHDLERAAPGEVHVADVATRWGFGNLGRFSAAYARRFGEQPRETLRR